MHHPPLPLCTASLRRAFSQGRVLVTRGLAGARPGPLGPPGPPGFGPIALRAPSVSWALWRADSYWSRSSQKHTPTRYGRVCLALTGLLTLQDDGQSAAMPPLRAVLEPRKNAVGCAAAVLQRLCESLFVFLRFCFLVTIFLPVIALMPVLLLPESSTPARSWYRYLTWTMKLAGPTFIKLGQWAASRRDIFSHEFCLQLGTLHSNAKMHSLAHTVRMVEESFGRPFRECFSEFDPTPIGVGAMAQVYVARLAGDDGGTRVAVKVLHPGIERTIATDLRIMRAFADIIDALPTMEWLSLPGEVETFSIMMQKQLDLRIEAQNLKRFARNFADQPDYAFPKSHPAYTSKQVLVEELVQGVSMEKVIKYCKSTALNRLIASKGLDAFLQMLLIKNFTHSDLHAGNMFLDFHKAPLGTAAAAKELEQSSRWLKETCSQEEWDIVWARLEKERYQPRISFIDAGLTTELSPQGLRNFIDLFKVITVFDGYRAGQLMVERSRTPDSVIDPEVFYLRSENLVAKVKQRTFALGAVSISDLLASMMDIVRKHHVRMESDFITIVLSMLLLEGIGRQLDPDLDIFNTAIPILRRVSSTAATGPISLESGSADDSIQMLKTWVLLELRRFITTSIKDINECVKYDGFSPNQ